MQIGVAILRRRGINSDTSICEMKRYSRQHRSSVVANPAKAIYPKTTTIARSSSMFCRISTSPQVAIGYLLDVLQLRELVVTPAGNSSVRCRFFQRICHFSVAIIQSSGCPPVNTSIVTKVQCRQKLKLYWSLEQNPLPHAVDTVDRCMQLVHKRKLFAK